MSKPKKSNKNKVRRLTEQQYAEYLMALKDEAPPDGYREGFEYIRHTMEEKKD